MRTISLGAMAAWQIAMVEARAAGYDLIEPEHLFIGICSISKILLMDNTGIELRVLAALSAEDDDLELALGEYGLQSKSLRRDIRRAMGNGGHLQEHNVIHRSDACKHRFSMGEKLVSHRGALTSLHLLAAILDGPPEKVAALFQSCGASPARLRDGLIRRLSSLPAYAREETYTGAEGAGHVSLLGRYGRDLTREAKEGRLGPFFGRRNEIQQIGQIFARKYKNNPIIVGDPGVGKTAIVEALAMKIASNDAPGALAGKRIIELSVGALVEGTKYRGDMEQRVLSLVEELKSMPEVVLFIDEIHMLVGAGRTEHAAMDASGLLKSALSQGEIRCIGATTPDDYMRYIESDPALERRFDQVVVMEPGNDEAVEILRGTRPRLESHHHVTITDEALAAAVELSVRFDTEHRLPDKAIDLVDRASAVARMAEKDMVEAGDISSALSGKTGIAIEVIASGIQASDCKSLLGMEKYLNEHIIGQEKAIGLICQRLIIAYSGLSSRRGPLATFLFSGPSGVGKTETAKQLAEFLFKGESGLIRLDMSEYMEAHSVSRLIGSPPGYIGHSEEEGQLTKKLRMRPYSVVLLDDIEKAHPRVLDLFLQVFDEGRITDTKGRTVDASNAIFIMTSNVLTQDSYGIGYHDMEDGGSPRDVSRLMRQKHKEKKEPAADMFRIELLNRVDEVVPFRPMKQEDAEKIVSQMLGEVVESLRRQYGVSLEIGDKVIERIAGTGYSSSFGARELRRTVERLVQAPLCNLAISGAFSERRKWKLACAEEGISAIPTDD